MTKHLNILIVLKRTSVFPGVAVDDLMSTILMNKGVVLKRQGDYEKTKMFFTRVKNIYMRDTSKYADKLPSLYFNLAAVEMGMHKYQAALSNLIECKRLSEQNDVRLIPKIDNLMARVYTSTGRTELAGKKYMDAISGLNEITTRRSIWPPII